MKTKIKVVLQVLFLLLVSLLVACGRSTKFVAPEIDPPLDLIPGYVPDGYELMSGFQIEVGNIAARFVSTGDDDRVLCDDDLFATFFNIKSPVGNDLLGVYYQNDDQLLLITKSHFPDGSMELWQSTYEASHEKDCDCDCDCIAEIVIGIPIPFRYAEFQEVRTIAGTEVAILEGPGGWMAVFVKGDYLIAVESALSLDENLKIVESLLQ